MFQQVRDDIQSVFGRDPAARNVFEILTTYPGLHALLIHRVSHKLWVANLKWLARWISLLSRWLTGIEIHPGAEIGQRFFIDHGAGVVIGETAVIGDDVMLYQGVTLGGTSLSGGKRHPTLDDGVIVGAGAKILGPFTVGKRARIGSNAVVVKPVPEGATVVGIPGRIVRIDGQAPQRESSQVFDAYGISHDMPDPVVEAFSKVLGHVQRLETQVEELSACLRAQGAQVKDCPTLKVSDFDLESSDEVVEAASGGAPVKRQKEPKDSLQ